MFKFIIFISLVMPILSAVAKERLIDDSYQAEKRLIKYVKSNPNLTRPALKFESGQEIEFNVSYKRLGKRWLLADVFHPVMKGYNSNILLDIAILIHGGGWRSGDKSHMYPLANLLAQNGYMVVTPEYRLSTEAIYPAAIDDLKDAIKWSQGFMKERGFILNRTVLIGGSSGGHLASLISFSSNDTTIVNQGGALKIDRLINLDGLLSTVTKEALANEDKRGENSALALWLGGSYLQQRKLWEQVSPVHYLDKHDPATLIISSGQSRFTAGKELLSKVKGFDFKYHQLDKVEHTFWLFEPYLSEIKEPILTFLASQN